MSSEHEFSREELCAIREGLQHVGDDPAGHAPIDVQDIDMKYEEASDKEFGNLYSDNDAVIFAFHVSKFSSQAHLPDRSSQHATVSSPDAVHHCWRLYHEMSQLLVDVRPFSTPEPALL